MDDNSSTGGHKNESFCKVCGDKASGKHYGVASCDGCRGFFKRSIRRNLEYICKENGRCIVDVTRRNQCQACRFKKCLLVNMKRDAVQHERSPRCTSSGSQHPHPALHHYPFPVSGNRFRPLQHILPSSVHPLFSATGASFHTSALLDHHHHHGPSNHFQHLPPYCLSGFEYSLNGFRKMPATPRTASPYFLTGTTTLGSCYSLPKSQSSTLSSKISQNKNNINKDDEVSSSEEIAQKSEITYPSARLELPDLNEPNSIIKTSEEIMKRERDLTSLNLFPAENIYESAAKLLFLAIKWAKTIPSFLQLSSEDQTILLEGSWNELFVLTAAQWMLPIDDGTLIDNAVAPVSRRAHLEEDAMKLREIITRLNVLRVDHTEYACLKALVLFKAECRQLSEAPRVELLQDQTHVMLQEYCISQNRVGDKAASRFGKLLLTLPAVQAVSKRGLEELLFKQTVGHVAVEKLLSDIGSSTH